MSHSARSLPRIDAALDQVRSFYAALDIGDADAAVVCLADDATDDRGEEGPVTGARAIVAARLDAEEQPEARWTLEALIADGERVAVECTVTWREPATGDLAARRDSEWLTLDDDGLITQISSYLGADEDDDGPVLTEDDFDWSLLETDEREL